jgi:hypothetical protein
MPSSDLTYAIALIGSVMLLMNVFLRSWYERVIWSVVLCSAGLWAFRHGDWSSLKLAAAGILVLSLAVSLGLQHISRQRAIQRGEITGPASVALPRLVRQIGYWSWTAGVVAAVVAIWLKFEALGEANVTIREAHWDAAVLISVYSLPAWIAPACLTSIRAEAFSRAERWVAWLPILLVAAIHAI